MKAYRQWLTMNSYEAMASLGGLDGRAVHPAATGAGDQHHGETSVQPRLRVAREIVDPLMTQTEPKEPQGHNQHGSGPEKNDLSAALLEPEFRPSDVHCFARKQPLHQLSGGPNGENTEDNFVSSVSRQD